MTTTTMTKAVCLPQHLFEDVIFKLRESTDFDIPDQSALQVQLEEFLKNKLSSKAEDVVTDAPATIDHSSHDANAVTTAYQDDLTSPPQQQTRGQDHKRSESSSTEEDDVFSPPTSKTSSPETSPHASPPSSTQSSPPKSPEQLSFDAAVHNINRMPKSGPSDHGNDNSGPDALSNPASDKTTPDLDAMADATSTEDIPTATSQSESLSNGIPDSPATEESPETHSVHSESASVHTEVVSDDASDSPATKESLELHPRDFLPDSSSASRPQSRASSAEAFGDMSFEERWDFNWESETGSLSLGSQSMAAYASPVQNGHRVRTSCDSHKDPGKWCVDSDGFIDEVSRAGGPRLTPYPYEEANTIDRHHIFPVLASWDFILFVTSVMKKYNIEPSSMGLYRHLWCHDLRMSTNVCLMFEAIRDSGDDGWLEATREIWKYLQDYTEPRPWQIVSVEIYDPIIRMYPRRIWYRKFLNLPLDDLSSELLGAIDTSEVIKTRWCHVQVHPGQNSVPAFCVLVHYRSCRDWRLPREQMVAVLDKHNLSNIAIFITKRKDWGESDEHNLMGNWWHG